MNRHQVSFVLIAALALAWRTIKVCTFELLAIIAILTTWAMGHPIPLWFWVALCLASGPTLVAVWRPRLREAAYYMARSRILRVTDIALSLMLLVVLTLMATALGPWWAVLILSIETCHHAVMLVLVTNHLAALKNVEGA